MNTVDALADAGGRAANFLDTGGKATSETVKKSFQVILQDDRVKVIFVNIFGGLTCKRISTRLFSRNQWERFHYIDFDQG